MTHLFNHKKKDELIAISTISKIQSNIYASVDESKGNNFVIFLRFEWN